MLSRSFAALHSQPLRRSRRSNAIRVGHGRRLVRLWMVVCALLGCVTLLATARAAMASRWSIQRTANPVHTNDSELFAVSCVSRTACTAVGSVFKRNGTGLTLAERWNGVSWSIQRTPNRAVGSGLLGGLDDVSCTSATVCTATGSADALTLAVRWNGAIWSTQRARTPSYGGDLQGVSCVSRTFCGAVGWAASDVLLAERWDGVGWLTQQTVVPSGAKDGSLSGVSCVSMTACTAVGYYTSRVGKEFSVAERWDGIGWSMQQSPQPPGAKSSRLSGVSCTSMVACTAVGYYNLTQPHDIAACGALGRRRLVDPTDSQPCPRQGQRFIKRVLREGDGVHCRRKLHRPRRHDVAARGALERPHMVARAATQPCPGEGHLLLRYLLRKGKGVRCCRELHEPRR
jgi:hypothetical protein